MAKNDAKTEIPSTPATHSAGPVTTATIPIPVSPEVQAELEQLRKENERLKTERQAIEASARAAVETIEQGAPAGQKKGPGPGQFLNSKGQVVDEKYKGTKHYQAGEKLFVNGAFIAEGERFSATDTQPGRAWLPLVPKAEPELVVAQPSASPNTQSL